MEEAEQTRREEMWTSFTKVAMSTGQRSGQERAGCKKWRIW